MIRRATLFVAAFLMAAPAVAAGQPRPAKVDYNFQIRPLLADRCYPCHGPDAHQRKAHLRLDMAASVKEKGVIVPGKPEQSEVYRRITAHDRDQMPPRKSNLHLTKDEIALIRRWIAEGAEFKPHWAFVPLPEHMPVPSVADQRWPTNPIDNFVLARLEQEGWQPSQPAPRTDWIRRVTFDLTGLPPTPAEVDAFVADHSPRAFENVVDRLLASKHFGERMAMDWLDAARYADSFGYQADADTNVWPWRDWVIRAFNCNLPYDQFLTWQIAGDQLPHATREQRLATTFCRLHRQTNEGGSIPEEWRDEYVADRVQTLSTAMLGLTLECARCHDHKFDPLTQRDYYGMGAFFNSIDEWGTYDSAAFRPTPTLPLPTPAQERQLAALARDVKAKQQHLQDVEKGRENAFQDWLWRGNHPPAMPGLVGDYALDQLAAGHKLANRANPKNPGSTSAANTLVPGKVGRALRFSGDDSAEFPHILGDLERTQPFTVSFWLRQPTRLARAILFQRESGTDTGFHGTELLLDEGRLFFAMVRFWPGNAIAVRSRQALPVGQWVQVTVSYDARGRAGGMHLYLDGQPVDTEIVRDHLTKNVQGGGSGLTFGQRFRSPGFKGGQVDEIKAFDRSLTPIEVAQLHDGKALADALKNKKEKALRPYYLAVVDSEAARARDQVRQARARLFAAQTDVFEIMTMQDMAKPRQAYILARGRYDAPKDKPVGRLTPAILPPFPRGAPRNRLGLARWLTEPHHPLTARVAANRFWQHFFGRGIVATPENFGTQGALPTHPELLDWLARDFVASGWDVKGLCKKIVLSSTYRQRSAVTPEQRERDPDNKLLARGPCQRLTAEELRDTALEDGGLLVDKIGGPPTRPYQPPGLWHGQNSFLPVYVADHGAGLHRRSLYSYWRRTSPLPDMSIFDMPTREVCTVRRQPTSTPLQPLVLLNDPQFVEAARGLGERMLREGGKTLADRLTFAFRVGATRRPTPGELQILVQLYQTQLDLFHHQPASAARYLQVGEYRPAPGLDPAELAAAAVTANAILNLDAAIMTR